MSKIDMAVAEHHIQKPDECRLEMFSKISRKGARHLANHCENSFINLSGLRTIGLKAATELLGTESRLVLNSLTEIDDDVAAILAQMKLPVVIQDAAVAFQVGCHLGSMKIRAAESVIDFASADSITDGTPGSNSPVHTGCYLKLTDEATLALSECICPVYLHKVKLLDGNQGFNLSQHKGFLSFTSLTRLSDEDAFLLEGHIGPLCFPSLADLSLEAADCLSVLDYILDLSGLSYLSIEVAAALAAYRGPELDLSGLTDLPKEVAAELKRSKTPLLRLTGLHSLSDESLAHLLQSKRTKYFLRRTIKMSEESYHEASKSSMRILFR